MQDGDDLHALGADQINDPIALIDQLAHVVAALGFGDGAPDLGELGELLNRGDDPLDKA